MTTDDIVTAIMRREGWDTYTNDPVDRGGPTKWGITQKAWGDYLGRNVSPAEIAAITESQARIFYHVRYIQDPGFSRIRNDRVKAMVVDCGVHHGQRRAARWLQQAVGVRTDGIVGPKTLAAVNSAPPSATILRIATTRTRFMAGIVARDRSQIRFLRGWVHRATEFLMSEADFLDR